MRIVIRIVLAVLTVLVVWNLSVAPRLRANDMPVTAEGCAVGNLDR